MVRALMIIRKYWVQVSPVVGTPPILVLSYKNHAIDEFLVDLVTAEPHLGRKPDMIRIGGGTSLDQRLWNFSERNLGRQDWEVGKLRQHVHWLHDLSTSCKALSQKSSSFSGYQVDMFKAAFPSENEKDAEKRRRKCAYEATDQLLATLVRYRRMLEAFEQDSDEDDYKMPDDTTILNDLDFIREEAGHMQRSHYHSHRRREALEDIPNLREGIEHYIELGHTHLDDPGEILLLFLRGWRPLPLCNYSYGYVSCSDLAFDHEAPLCANHRCGWELEDWSRCQHPVIPGRQGCKDHACGVLECPQKKLAEQDFCSWHACFVCLKEGARALEATDDPPRNACEKHALCWQCDELALPGRDACAEHDFIMCEAKVNGEPCRNRAASSLRPFCKDHMHLSQRRWGFSWGWSPAAPVLEESDGEERADVEENRKCIGQNHKGKPCQSKARPGSRYCDVHAPSEQTLEEMREAVSKDQVAVEPPPKQSFYAAEDIEDAEFASAGSEGSENPPNMDEDGKYDNQDEVEEADHLQHLREVYDFAEWSGESSSEDEAKEEENFQDQAEDAATKDTKQWTWDMSFQERWEACQMFMSQQRDTLSIVIGKVKDQSWLYRKKLHDAEVRASARVYEDKSIIGGTIVGCISRLEAIRSTRPFAVVVEEASEVLEPLLFSCFCDSTVKLEMIGDHLQLQPSIMQKFAFERVNNVNISMFERLITAPNDHKAPSSVLSVQRRMRKDVCDLTREYYAEITSIEDHETCWTKKIPGSIASGSFYKGREVPGVASHIYLWTHSGSQGKAEVGLSKINRQEADMAVWLAYYLVDCGVPKPSIVILTPYKGQLMLMRKQLLSDQSQSWLLSHNPSDADQIRLSTVDRFQGDEGDVVIASLVVDEHSRTPFVKLQNRMIVLLSRARLGMYILGNTGYFENSRPEKHWQRTFEILQDGMLTLFVAAFNRESAS
ncbi:NFX1-type zinc finger-containing protein 1 [Durusdinium trenchii]|uniref:NFX1-type zinc finger-containing protein 1 n=1 Tax=Durusdinium trenchii TaxID=1381693 RepID=A0ABP0LJP7_9DINO